MASGAEFDLDGFLGAQSDQVTRWWRAGDKIGKSALTEKESGCAIVLAKDSGAWGVYEEIGLHLFELGVWISAATDRKGEVQLCLTIMSRSGAFPAINMPSELVQFLGQHHVSIDVDII